LASTLSFIAGIVNIAGVSAQVTLTTNVTGHFAFAEEEIALKDYSKALTILALYFLFFPYAFTSNFLVEIVSIKTPNLPMPFQWFCSFDS
jgi:uncharacterized membrane protein YoaK (UPF0700 family)